VILSKVPRPTADLEHLPPKFEDMFGAGRRTLVIHRSSRLQYLKLSLVME